jgi:fructosamine-3-kinase
MWHAIERHISTSIGTEFKIKETIRISGGDISESYMVSDDEQRFFVKINSKGFLSHFIAEADNLSHLAQTSSVKTPSVIDFGKSKTSAFLILDYLPTRPLQLAEPSHQFGQHLAYLHNWGEQKEFGFDNDNYIGATPQSNRWQKKWSNFFSDQRIGCQLELLKEKGIEFGDTDEIVGVVKEVLSHHNPKPSLLHGNLWHGNCADTPQGPVCYDSAVYWGDSECDLAMTELFGRFPDAFYKGYNSIKIIDPGYKHRKEIYNLYHILNHCNQFGGHYLGDAQLRIEKLLQQTDN